MRKLVTHQRQPFRDDYEIELGIQLSKGMTIERQNIQLGIVSQMIDGEPRIDMENNRKVTKIDGKLYKEVVDENSEVRYAAIT